MKFKLWSSWLWHVVLEVDSSVLEEHPVNPENGSRIFLWNVTVHLHIVSEFRRTLTAVKTWKLVLWSETYAHACAHILEEAVHVCVCAHECMHVCQTTAWNLMQGNLHKKPVCFRTFLSLLLNGHCRKLCYDAQEVIMFLVDKYGFETDQGE
jgi:hypothetical protein